MKRTYWTLALASALLLAAIPLMAGNLKRAEDKKGVNQAPPDAAAKVKPSAKAEAVQQLHLAHSLIEYGRKNKAPEALITAARILAAQGTIEMKESPTQEQPAGAPKDAKNDKNAPDISPKALLVEAKKLSNDNPAVVALANSVELSRGAPGGPQVKLSALSPMGTDRYTFTFKGGEFALVGVAGDGDTRLDLYIYDQNGNLVTSHVGPGDKRLTCWVPNWTGTYTVQVVNRGTRWNWYALTTN